MTHYIPLGTSEAQNFQLKDGTTNIDGTGLTVALEIKTYASAAVTSPPSAAWLSQAAGTVTVTGTGTLALGAYLVRFKLTDGGGNVAFAPNGAESDIWRVVKIAQP